MTPLGAGTEGPSFCLVLFWGHTGSALGLLPQALETTWMGGSNPHARRAPSPSSLCCAVHSSREERRGGAEPCPPRPLGPQTSPSSVPFFSKQFLQHPASSWAIHLPLQVHRKPQPCPPTVFRKPPVWFGGWARGGIAHGGGWPTPREHRPQQAGPRLPGPRCQALETRGCQQSFAGAPVLCPLSPELSKDWGSPSRMPEGPSCLFAASQGRRVSPASTAGEHRHPLLMEH